MDREKSKIISLMLGVIALALAAWVVLAYTLTGPSPSVELEPLLAAATAEFPLLDLNEATLEELEELPGIGPALAQRVLDYRAENGPFTGSDDVMAVSGIGQAIYEAIEPYITY